MLIQEAQIIIVAITMVVIDPHIIDRIAVQLALANQMCHNSNVIQTKSIGKAYNNSSHNHRHRR